MRLPVVLAGLFGPLAASTVAHAEPRSFTLECSIPGDVERVSGAVAVPLSCRMSGQSGPLVAVALIRPAMLLAWETLNPFDSPVARTIELNDPFPRALSPGYLDPFEGGRFAQARTDGELVNPFEAPRVPVPDDDSSDPESQVFP